MTVGKGPDFAAGCKGLLHTQAQFAGSIGMQMMQQPLQRGKLYSLGTKEPGLHPPSTPVLQLTPKELQNSLNLALSLQYYCI